jgi:hypothetical protein
MRRIAPEEIERCFMNRIRAIKQEYAGEIADLTSDAIDGKTARGRFKGGREIVAYRQCAGGGEPAGIWTSKDRRKKQ